MSAERQMKVLANCDQGLTTEQKAQARANIGAGEALTAGPNIDIINNVVSTEKVVVEPGSNVTITSSSDSETRTITYNIAATGTTYTAGTNIQISNTNEISATDTTYNVFNDSTDGLVPAPSAQNYKFLRDDHTWQYPLTGDFGDANHMSYITQGSNGNLYVWRGKRMMWEYSFGDPSIELTAADISNGYAEFRFVLGTAGLRIASNGDMICIKGYNIQMGNILNGKQLSFYIDSHDNPGSPRMLMDTGFQTYTESVVNNYDWKAFKAIGLTMNNNVGEFDAVLRVPLSGSESAGDTYKIDGSIMVSIFGVAGNDS